MKKKIHLSDIKLLLYLFAPKEYNLIIFDPYNRLDEDQPFELKKVNSNAPSILVTLADEIISYKGLSLESFEMIFDFGKSKTPCIFNKKTLEFINNPNGTMRWLYTPTQLKSVLSFYSTSSFKAKIIALGVKIAHYARLSYFIRNGKCTISYQNDLNLENALQKVKYDNYALFTGTSGYNRTAVLALENNGKTTHFAKIALNKQGLDLLLNEKRNLRSLDGSLQHITVPKVVEVKDPAIVIVSNETQKEMGFSTKLGKQHINALVELFDSSKKAMALRDTFFWEKITGNINLINTHKTNAASIKIKKLLQQMQNSINPKTIVCTTLSHSDFTPWNIKVGGDKLYLYDWELAQRNTPALFDLIHFHFQNGIILKKHSLKQILTEIEKSCSVKKIKQIISTYSIDLEMYIQLYLLRTVSYFLATFQQQKSLSSEQKKQLVCWENALQMCSTIDNSKQHRKVFITAFNAEMKRTSHAFLKFSAESLDNLSYSSDLDIAVLKKDTPNILQYCRKHLLVERVKSVKKSFMTTVELFFKDGSFLSIDLIYQFKRKNLQMMEIEPLLRSTYLNKHGVMIPERRFDMEYTYLFYAINEAEIPSKYFYYFGQSDYDNREKTFHYLNDKYQLNFSTYTELFVGAKNVSRKINTKLSEQYFNKGLLKVKNTWNYIVDTIKSIFVSEGFIVTLSGVDGVGKSTIIQKVKKQMEMRFRKEVVLLRHRPGILPILSSIKYGSTKKAEQIASVTKPRQGQNNNIISSFIRFSYYYTDYLFGQVYIYFKYILRGKVVLYDRYYFDFIADSERSNIRLNKRFIELLYLFVLKPKLNILLWADPFDVYQRKQELEPKTIYELSVNYKNLFLSYRKKYNKSTYRTIENIRIDQTVSTIMEEFAQVA